MISETILAFILIRSLKMCFQFFTLRCPFEQLISRLIITVIKCIVVHSSLSLYKHPFSSWRRDISLSSMVMLSDCVWKFESPDDIMMMRLMTWGQCPVSADSPQWITGVQPRQPRLVVAFLKCDDYRPVPAQPRVSRGVTLGSSSH